MVITRSGEFFLPCARSRLQNPEKQRTVRNNPKLGNLSLLPVEVRNNIWSRLLDTDYRQRYVACGNSLAIENTPPLSSVPGLLQVNATLSKEAASALTLGRHCEVQIEECKVTTDFPLHDLSQVVLRWTVQQPTAVSSYLSISACARINVTVHPPSPRSGGGFLACRQNVHAFIGIINRKARDINPQICVRLGLAGTHYTTGYNDFAMLFGPFVRLNSLCKAVMVFRTIGVPVLQPKVESYCNLIEEAMSFNAQARRELKLHQSLIDIKLPIALLPYNVYTYRTGYQQPALALTRRDLVLVNAAAATMTKLYAESGQAAPV